ncbi:MAG: alpha/beta hydrolase [Anaerolineales bacterium]|nr:alpha/beta hydrolase [Anaerolineales bacterium]
MNKMKKTDQRQPMAVWLKRGLLGILILIVALPLAGFAYQTVATEIDLRNFPAPGQMVEMGGYQLHLHCAGAGSPTVIMESGLGSTSLDWSLVQPELAQITRVCVYDRAGLGWSEFHPAGPPRTSRQIVQELHTLLAKADVPGPFILVGLSAGGMHVQMYANQYPEDIQGLVLVDPTPAQFMADLADQKFQALLPDLNQFDLIQKLEAFGLLRLIPLPGSEVLEQLPAELQQEIHALSVRTGVARALYEEAAGIEASIHQVASLEPLPAEIPITIIWHGIPVEPIELEPLAEASLRELTGQSENGLFIIAENSGHYVTFDRPDIVVTEVSNIIKMIHMISK